MLERPFDSPAYPEPVGEVEHVPLNEMAYNLGPAQYGRTVHPPETPIPVKAWIQNRKGHHRVDGHAVAWTRTAVHVRYIDEHGRVGWVWVWANAITRR